MATWSQSKTAAKEFRTVRAVSRYARMIGLYRNWWSVYRNRMRRPTGRAATYRLRSGETFVLGDGIHEVQVLNEIWFDRAYEPTPEFRLQRGWNVIDAGAHKGIFTVRAARAGARVIALEPEARNSAALHNNLELNGCHNAQVLAAALWSEPGEALLHYFGGGASTNFSLVLGADDGSTDMVKTVTLESLVNEMGRVNLLKLDIEGAELPVLKSTPSEVLGRIDRVVMDYLVVEAPEQGEGIAREIAALLEAENFECTIQRQGCIFYAFRPASLRKSTFLG